MEIRNKNVLQSLWLIYCRQLYISKWFLSVQWLLSDCKKCFPRMLTPRPWHLVAHLWTPKTLVFWHRRFRQICKVKKKKNKEFEQGQSSWGSQSIISHLSAIKYSPICKYLKLYGHKGHQNWVSSYFPQPLLNLWNPNLSKLNSALLASPGSTHFTVLIGWVCASKPSQIHSSGTSGETLGVRRSLSKFKNQ